MAGTTPVLSARSFLFTVQVLLGAREDRVTYWWYFRHHYIYNDSGENFDRISIQSTSIEDVKDINQE